MLPRKDLWRAVISYTVGELVRSDFSDYTPYAYQTVFANGLSQSTWKPLERDGKPYWESKVSLTAAVATLAKDVGQPRR